ncbi:MAG: hypothetical protein ACTSRG_01195 [Candidatus Helarchaeota archaeon]
MTTITINEKTKEELLKIAAQLQIKRREKINYDSAIIFLIEYYMRKKDPSKLKKACKKINGVDLNNVINDLYRERKKDEISF